MLELKQLEKEIQKVKFCLNCDKPSFNKFCERRCQNTYNARSRRQEKSTITYLDTCLHCGVSIQKPRRKFCSLEHKNAYNHKNVYGHKYHNRYRSSSPEKFLSGLRSYYGRHETISKEFLENLYYLQNGMCAISGVEMTYVAGEGNIQTNISIDRIDSSVGYEEDNIQLVCRFVNTMKMQATTEELIDWCEAIVNNNPKDNSKSNLRVTSKSKNRSFPRTKTAGKKG